VANTDPIRIRRTRYGAIRILKSCLHPLSNRWPDFGPFKVLTTLLTDQFNPSLICQFIISFFSMSFSFHLILLFLFHLQDLMFCYVSNSFFSSSVELIYKIKENKNKREYARNLKNFKKIISFLKIINFMISNCTLRINYFLLSAEIHISRNIFFVDSCADLSTYGEQVCPVDDTKIAVSCSKLKL